MLDLMCVLSHSVMPNQAAHRAPLSMEFSRHGYWSGLPFSSPEDLPNPGIKPVSLAFPILAGGFFTTSSPGKPSLISLLTGLPQSGCIP